jgi:hypothetical protein
MRRIAAVAVLALAVGVAAVLAVLAYRSGNRSATPPEPLVRDAIALFQGSHAADATAAERRRAEADARRLHERGGDRTSRSLGSNLLGVLAFENAALDPARADDHVAASVDAFRDAIRLDPANDDAKFNLELILTLVAEDTAGTAEAGRAAGPPGASGAGAGARGGGY